MGLEKHIRRILNPDRESPYSKPLLDSKNEPGFFAQRKKTIIKWMGVISFIGYLGYCFCPSNYLANQRKKTRQYICEHFGDLKSESKSVVRSQARIHLQEYGTPDCILHQKEHCIENFVNLVYSCTPEEINPTDEGC